MFAEVCANVCEYAYEDIATVENYLKEQNFKFKKIKYFFKVFLEMLTF